MKTRTEILEAAAQIFRQKGFHAASMQDIADAVQLKKASLYHHVSSKQEILLELLEHAMDLLIDRLETITLESAPAAGKLRQATRTYLSILTEYRDLAAVLLLEFRSLDPELQARHNPRRDYFEKLWRDMIEEGMESGDFVTVDASLTVKSLLGAMNWSIIWYKPEGSLKGNEIADCFIDLWLQGLLKRNEGLN